MKNFALILLGLGFICVMLALGSGLSHRFGMIHFRTALTLFAWAGMLAPIVISLAVISVALGFYKKVRRSVWICNFVSLAFALSVFIPAYIFKAKAASVPRIHDITTDTANPPKFIEAHSVYGGDEIADQQKKAYPEVQPKILSMTKADAFEEALNVIKNLGWEITEVRREVGHIEAVDTTFFFGFKDDVVIRLTEQGPTQTRVDVRSVSRVGLSDVGANAARILRFLRKLPQ